jgi:formylglycine-generating enzyme
LIAFLNSVAKTDTYGLYDPRMATVVVGGIVRSGSNGSYSYSAKPHMGNKPVVYVSAYDSARFANWLQNGQPVGLQDASTTEDGAYTLTGLNSMSGRNAGALYFLPTEHEWDKAAFYEPGATTRIGDGWWMYPSHSQVFPTPALADEFGNVTNPGLYTVNFRKEANWNGTVDTGNLTTVGSAGNTSFYGAMDMAGNVFEWTVADPTKPDPNGWGPYTVRGGSYRNAGHVDVYERNLLHHDNHNITNFDVGFRLAAAISLYAADFNGDGVVDGDDLVRWKDNFGLTTGATKSTGDANGDGVVDGRDFLAWQRQLGSGVVAPAVGASAAVPEPAGLGLLLAALLASLPFLRKVAASSLPASSR